MKDPLLALIGSAVVRCYHESNIWWDIRERGFRDARLDQRVHRDSEDIAHWTKAIASEEKARGKPA
jgi:hypothetical protein